MKMSLLKKSKDDSLDENMNQMVENLLKDDEGELNLSCLNLEDENVKKDSELSCPPVILINGVSYQRMDMPIKDDYALNLGSKSGKLGVKMNSLSLNDTNKIRKMNPEKDFTQSSGYTVNINSINESSNKNFKIISPRSINSGKKSILSNININRNINVNANKNIPTALNINVPQYNIIEGGSSFSNSLSGLSGGEMNINMNNINKIRSNRHAEEGINVQLNEFEEILENRVKLLEKIDDESLIFFRGNFLNVIKSQNGSRILQKALNKTSSEILAIIFEEIKLYVPELMIDSYANYFCQRFYDFLEYFQKIEFLLIMKNHIVNIGNSTIGTYPLQAIVDQMKTKEERKIMIESVRDNILEMCQHPQGTHVIEKMILCFEEESIREIYEIVINNFMMLACHSNGLCVTKKVISCSRNPYYIEILQKILLENGKTLVQNQHGNYSIQVALENWDYKLIHPMIVLFNDQFFQLSTQKFSSNVVEKCLERGGEQVLSRFLDEICHKTKIVELIKSPYGNYVIQKALKLASGYHKGKLTGIIKKHLEKLHDKKLISKWKTILGNICGNTLQLQQPRHKNNFAVNSTNESNFSSNSLNNSKESNNNSNSPQSNRSYGSNKSVSSINSNHSFSYNQPPMINSFMKMQMNTNQNINNMNQNMYQNTTQNMNQNINNNFNNNNNNNNFYNNFYNNFNNINNLNNMNNNQFFIPQSMIQRGYKSENNSPMNSNHSPTSSFSKIYNYWQN